MYFTPRPAVYYLIITITYKCSTWNTIGTEPAYIKVSAGTPATWKEDGKMKTHERGTKSERRNGYTLCECGGLMGHTASTWLGEDQYSIGGALLTTTCAECGYTEKEILKGG